jgi:hypothetical protein
MELVQCKPAAYAVGFFVDFGCNQFVLEPWLFRVIQILQTVSAKFQSIGSQLNTILQTVIAKFQDW